MIYNIELKNLKRKRNCLDIKLSLNNGDYNFNYKLTFTGSLLDLYYEAIIDNDLNNKNIHFDLNKASVKVNNNKSKDAFIKYLETGGESFFKCFKFLHLINRNKVIRI